MALGLGVHENLDSVVVQFDVVAGLPTVDRAIQTYDEGRTRRYESKLHHYFEKNSLDNGVSSGILGGAEARFDTVAASLRRRWMLQVNLSTGHSYQAAESRRN